MCHKGFSLTLGIEQVYDVGMFEALARDIEELEIPVNGAAIAHAVALRDQLSAKVAAAVGAFDEARLWDLDAATSMTAWLSLDPPIRYGEARRRLLSIHEKCPPTRDDW